MSEGWPDTVVEELAEWITGRTGLTFPPSRRGPAAAALQRALRSGGDGDAAALRARLERDPASLDELLAELTVGETYFFRHPEQFELVRNEILPALAPHPPRPLRLWSAGCATGEEAYSLAIAAGESGREARVVGTDLSRARLAVAHRGRYRRWSLRGLSDERIREYFRPAGTWYELLPELRAGVEFRYLNLVEDRYPASSTGIWGMDLIFCRNVLIYLDRESVRRVARKLVDSLSEEGFLLLGASDPLISDLAPVEVSVTPAGLVYRRRSGSPRAPAERVPPRASVEAPAAPEREPPRSPHPPPAPPAPAPTPADPTPEVPAPPPEVPADLSGEGKEEALRHVRSLANQGRLAEAGRACAAALDRFRDSAELLYLHALLLLSGGKPREAAEAARRALYLDRELVVAHLLRGDALLRAGDPAGARQALRRAQRLLAELPPEAEVPASDGEPAGRLLRMTELRLSFLDRTDA